MGWYHDDSGLTKALRREGYEVDESDVFTARDRAGKGFPIGDEDLKEIVPLLGQKKVKQERTASLEEIAEFRRKLASREWRHLMAAAQMSVGLLPLDAPGNENAIHNKTTICSAIDALERLVLRNQDGAFGHVLPLIDNDISEGVVQLIELQRVAALLASYLGTSSRQSILRSLILGVPPEPEALQPASPGKAIDEFHAGLFGLLGFSWPGASMKVLELRDLLLAFHVQRLRGELACHWDEARIFWNRQYPDWVYDATEAFRKACERAEKRRPNPNTN